MDAGMHLTMARWNTVERRTTYSPLLNAFREEPDPRFRADNMWILWLMLEGGIVSCGGSHHNGGADRLQFSCP